MKNKIVLMICIGLLLWASGLNPRLNAESKKEKIPKGLKTKTEINYKLVEESGEYKKVLDNKWIYRYDKKGNQIELAVSDADGKLAGKTLFKYDDKGNQIEVAGYDAAGKLTEKSLFKYDDQGNRIEWAYYGADGELASEGLSKYDDKGNMIERAEYKEEFGKVKEVPTFQTVLEYEFYDK